MSNAALKLYNEFEKLVELNLARSLIVNNHTIKYDYYIGSILHQCGEVFA